MFTVVELSRTAASEYYFPPGLYPFSVQAKLYYGETNGDIADFWTTTFGVTEPVRPKRTITGLVYKYTTTYSSKESLLQSLADEQSFYWNNSEQILSIHLASTHQYVIKPEPVFQFGVAIGLTKDTPRVISGREYLPFISQLEPVAYEVDKFNYNQLNFIVNTLTLNNLSGFFNEFKDAPLYGNLVQVFTGEDGDTFDDLILRREYYVEDYDFSVRELIIELQDPRKSLTSQFPENYFTVNDYPNVGSKAEGKIIPFGYGALHDVPGYCVNEEALSATVFPVFKFLEEQADSTMTITMYVDDVWIPATGVTIDSATWEVTITGALSTSGTSYGVYDVRADLNGISNVYASDIIVDLNDRFLGIPYDTSNYDTTEWAIEEVYLQPIAYYVDKVDYIYNAIKDLQALSSVGFKYSMINGKRTIRCDNPNRALAVTVPFIDVFNIEDVVADSNKDNMYNFIQIGYHKSIKEGTSNIKQNREYQEASFRLYRIYTVYDVESGLTSATWAQNRADIQAEDLHLIRTLYEVVLSGTAYLSIKLYDIIQIELDMYDSKATSQKVIQCGRTSADVLIGTDPTDCTHVIQSVEIDEEYKIVPIKELFGTIRGQVISVMPDYDLELTTVIVRERPVSEVWSDIF